MPKRKLSHVDDIDPLKPFPTCSPAVSRAIYTDHTKVDQTFFYRRVARDILKGIVLRTSSAVASREFDSQSESECEDEENGGESPKNDLNPNVTDEQRENDLLLPEIGKQCPQWICDRVVNQWLFAKHVNWKKHEDNLKNAGVLNSASRHNYIVDS